MKEHTRKVTLLQKLETSTFAVTNHKIYGGTGRILGNSKHAEKVLLSQDRLIKAILPMVIGVSPSSPTWDVVVRRYLYAFEVDVQKGGKDLNVSYTVDFDDKVTRENIKKLAIARGKKVVTEEDGINLINAAGSNGVRLIDEMDLYKYIKPVNYTEYFAYVYCLNHNRVANNQSLITKSENIDFFLVTALDIKNEKRKQYELNKSINNALRDIEEHQDFKNAMYSVLNITAGDDLDKAIALDEVSKSAPRKFLASYRDKNIMTRALIEEYIRKQIFKRVPGSSLIVDATDGTVIIGVNIEAALTFFSNADNEALLTQFEKRYKSL